MQVAKSISTLRQSLHLQAMVCTMTADEKLQVAGIIKTCDIARLLRNTTIQQELKSSSKLHSGKIKRFLSALSKNKHAMSGVDVLFERNLK